MLRRRRRRLLAAAGATALIVGAGSVAAGEGLTWGAPKKRYLPRRDIPISLVNDGSSEVTFDNPWTIASLDGDPVASMRFDDTTVAPGETLTWLWDQRLGDCTSSGCSYQGGTERPYAGAGRYRVSVNMSDVSVIDDFDIGRFFTLGFEARKARFVVFVNQPHEIRQMRAEARAEDKTLIVSGVVGRRVRYNEDWSYSMRPGSIVLGEVFIESCDGSPRYVEKHREQWYGERWCPWSSYVAREGK